MSALIISANDGTEQGELTQPLDAPKAAGSAVAIAAPTVEPTQRLVGDKDAGERVKPNTTLDDVDPADFDLLVIPGGTIDADALRTEKVAVALVRAIADAGKAVAEAAKR
jgi:protease I